MHDNDVITIVAGLPRSGTSMMMQILEAGGIPALTDKVRTPDEDNPKGYYEFEAVKQTKEDPSWLAQAPGKVVKMVYRLLYDLPDDREYHVVMMRRDLAEIVRSQQKMLSRNGLPKPPVSDEQVIGMFERELAGFKRWTDANEKMHVCEVWYNDILQSPLEQLDAVNEFLGGGLNVEAMVQIVDPSLYRNRSGQQTVASPSN